MATEQSPRRRVAILGAGPAGVAAAWGLSATKALRDRYEVTVYQVGWRAGGKIASGRGPAPEHRMLQNGTHYLFGVYYNALSMARTAYRELAAVGEQGFGPFDDAFMEQNFLVLKHKFRGEWTDWPIQFPRNFRRLGSDEIFPGPTEVLSTLLQGLIEIVAGWRAARESAPRAPGPLRQGFDEVVNKVVTAMLEEALALVRSLDGDGSAIGLVEKRLLSLLRMGRNACFRLLRHRTHRDINACRSWIMIDLATTFLIGIIEDEALAPGGMAALDQYDYREWLKLHGATDMTVDSPVVMAWYDAIASYVDGDVDRPSVSMGPTAAAMLYSGIGYQGAYTFKARRELGESWIAPIVEALRHRGVRFRYFNRVREVVADGDSIVRIRIEQQVHLRHGGPDDYDPFVRIKGHKAWPAAPKQEDIVETIGDANLEDFYTTWRGEDYELVRGEDFDDAIYAMPVETVPHYCPRIVETRPSWQRMIEHVRGVDTRSLWLYFRPDLRQLGWRYPNPLLISYGQPFPVWEDTTYLTRAETWPEGLEPGTVSSLFSVQRGPRFAPGPDEPGAYPEDQELRARTASLEFLMHSVGGLWPAAVSESGAIDWSVLVDPRNGSGSERFEFQVVNSNYGPTQRYTVAFPGALKHRLRADESGFRNLYLAGDWTKNGFDVGCIEGAVVSGLLAARAICGEVEIIQLYKHSGL